jgi:hypothetical protein
MNKLKRTIAAIGTTAAIITGSALIAAPSANAATYGSPYRVNLGFNHCAVFMYVDYNWWEEVFQGKRDGAEYQYRVLC